MAILLDKVIYKYPKRVIPALNVPHEEIGAGIHLLLGENGAGKADMRLPGRNVAEMVRIHSGFFPNFSLDMLARNLEDFAIDEEKKFKDMSLGTRQKAVIAYFLSLGTDYLLLDEPANGLDIESKETLARMIAFTETPVPPADALYSEPRAGRYRGIVRAGTHEDSECDIDFHLLYNALHNERFSSRFSELKN